jgi:hypothetical protein
MSHLCHTGPGADDNGSGCAALLGIASAIGGCDFRLPVSLRFLWTPEMVGTAAWAHTRGTGQPPECVINLDMAGQNQQVCGGGLTLERPHDMVSSALVPVADAVMDRLPRPMSYSGAVPSPPWGWTWTPYVGASDHLIYADSRPRVATIQLGHWPDRFNNSSADAADHVDPGELGRATLIAAATAVLMATLTEADDSWLRRATQAWAIRFVAAPAEWPAREHPVDGDVIDPHDPARLAEVLRYRLTVVQRVLRATSWWVPDSSWPDAFLTALGRLADSISGAGGEHASRSRTSGGPVVRRWDGPFNLRHVLDQASAESDAWLFDRMRNDPRATLAAVTSVVMAIDGSRSVAELASFAACQSELPISRTLVSELIALLARLGLVSVSGPAPRRPGGRR